MTNEIDSKMVCKICNKSLPVSAFYVNKDGSYDYRCRSCQSENKKRIYKERVGGGLCVYCGTPVLDGICCSLCRQVRDKNARIFRQKHPKLHSKRQREYIRRLKGEVFNAYGGAFCSCCGESHWEFLSIDHIDNNGAAHRKEIGSVNIYNWLKSNGFPPGFQVLCFNCNLARGFYGYCPHDKENKQ